MTFFSLFTLKVLCFNLKNSSTSVNPSSQVLSAPGQPQRLHAFKVNVVNAAEANLFIVFANKRIGDEVYFS